MTRPELILLTGLLAMLSMPGPVRAAAFDCNKAAMPMDFVICSTPELGMRNDVHAEAWGHARASLDSEGRTALVTWQKRWIRELTAACGLPERGKPSEPAVAHAQDCILQGLRNHTRELAEIAKSRLAPGVDLLRLEFADPDQKTKEVLAQVLKSTKREPKAVWGQIADGEPAYLFLIDSDNCGASDCPIRGYRRTATGWIQVYDAFGGDSLVVLISKTAGHHDLRQYQSQGHGENIMKTSRWSGSRYETQEVKLVPW